MVEIRRLRRTEFIEFMHILCRIFPERANPTLFLDLYEVFPDGFVVALDKNEIIGFAIGVVTHEHKGRILLIGVDEKYQNKGIGSKLLRGLLLTFFLKGITEVELEVRVSNVRAIKFYEKRGFRKKFRLDNYYEDGEDAYIMVKSL